MGIFDFEDYKLFVNSWIKGQPRKGYGALSRMAEYLGTTSVVMSQVFKADRDLNLEQAAKLTLFMNLETLEADYFLLLVQRQRAGTHQLKQILTRQIEEIKDRGLAVKNRIKHSQLGDKEKALFYSSWYYVATWLAATLPEYSRIDHLSSHFAVPEAELRDVLQFLLDKSLLKKTKAGFDFGANVVHVPHDSPYAIKHHMNWRIKAMQSMDQKKDTNLHYTAPMSMSHELRTEIRKKLVDFIQEQTQLVSSSDSERLSCLNIDFFDF